MPELDDKPFYVGQRVLIDIEFRRLGVPTDPTIIQVTAKNPVTGSNVVLTYPTEGLTKVSTGVYEAAVQMSDPGQWHFRVEGAGVVDAVTETWLDVLPTTVGSGS